MKFNWMHRYECSEDSKGLLQMVKSFEDHGVESVLLPYGSDGTDYFIHIPDFIKITKKINFMMAIRPYSVSPEYITKSFKSMNNFEPNRLSINVVAGYFDSVEEDIVFKKYHREISEIDTSEKRVALCDTWIQKFIEIMNKDLPRIWMVGTSDKTIEIANKYATDFLVTQQLINENKINKIKAKTVKKRWKVSDKACKDLSRIAPNLIDQNFVASKPDEKWVSDITYVKTNEGWLYVAAVMDLFSRKIVGLGMGDRIDNPSSKLVNY